MVLQVICNQISDFFKLVSGISDIPTDSLIKIKSTHEKRTQHLRTAITSKEMFAVYWVICVAELDNESYIILKSWWWWRARMSPNTELVVGCFFSLAPLFFAAHSIQFTIQFVYCVDTLHFPLISRDFPVWHTHTDDDDGSLMLIIIYGSGWNEKRACERGPTKKAPRHSRN